MRTKTDLDSVKKICENINLSGIKSSLRYANVREPSICYVYICKQKWENIKFIVRARSYDLGK